MGDKVRAIGSSLLAACVNKVKQLTLFSCVVAKRKRINFIVNGAEELSSCDQQQQINGMNEGGCGGTDHVAAAAAEELVCRPGNGDKHSDVNGVDHDEGGSGHEHGSVCEEQLQSQEKGGSADHDHHQQLQQEEDDAYLRNHADTLRKHNSASLNAIQSATDHGAAAHKMIKKRRRGRRRHRSSSSGPSLVRSNSNQLGSCVEGGGVLGVSMRRVRTVEDNLSSLGMGGGEDEEEEEDEESRRKPIESLSDDELNRRFTEFINRRLAQMKRESLRP